MSAAARRPTRRLDTRRRRRARARRSRPAPARCGSNRLDGDADTLRPTPIRRRRRSPPATPRAGRRRARRRPRRCARRRRSRRLRRRASATRRVAPAVGSPAACSSAAASAPPSASRRSARSVPRYWRSRNVSAPASTASAASLARQRLEDARRDRVQFADPEILQACNYNQPMIVVRYVTLAALVALARRHAGCAIRRPPAAAAAARRWPAARSSSSACSR